jgi:hypothetical protein
MLEGVELALGAREGCWCIQGVRAVQLHQALNGWVGGFQQAHGCQDKVAGWLDPGSQAPAQLSSPSTMVTSSATMLISHMTHSM